WSIFITLCNGKIMKAKEYDKKQFKRSIKHRRPVK
ncbi:MAG: hypothetical protein ACI9S8_003292, partial [Chlamydiales bacterium]